MAKGGRSPALNDFSQSSFNFMGRYQSLPNPLLTCCACCLQVGHFDVDFAMDVIIQQSVRKEMRRSASLVRKSGFFGSGIVRLVHVRNSIFHLEQ